MSLQDWLRAAHVLGAVLLLGNVIVTGVWAAWLIRQPAVDHRVVARAIILTDWCFTLPGGALLATTGIVMAWRRALPLWDTPFVRVGLLGLVIATTAWLLVLVPLQRRLVCAADAADARRLFGWWSVVGWSATVPLLAGLWAMAGRYSG